MFGTSLGYGKIHHRCKLTVPKGYDCCSSIAIEWRQLHALCEGTLICIRTYCPVIDVFAGPGLMS